MPPRPLSTLSPRLSRPLLTLPLPHPPSHPHHFHTTPHPHINKLAPTAAAALHPLKSHALLAVGGFGLSGVPTTLIHAIRARPDITDLTVASNNAGTPTSGLGPLLASRQIRKMIASYIGENTLFEELYLRGDVELELTPQGTLAERCAAAGRGVPAFYTPAGVGTVVMGGELPLRYARRAGGAEAGEAQGAASGSATKAPTATPAVSAWTPPKDVRIFDSKPYVLEHALHADVAIVRAQRADRHGNARFRYAAQNFNGAMARCARHTVVEAEEIVEVGALDPGDVHLPGIYVSAVVQAEGGAKEIEKRVNARPGDEVGVGGGTRERIVRRAAREFKDGMYANLGIGMPMMAAGFVAPDVSVTLQSENGILGLGPYPAVGAEDADLINAGKETVTLLPGASTFGSEESFGMIRAGRIDLTVLGAMQVSERGDLANWMLPGKVKGFGGAMDLVSNPAQTRVVVVTEHVDKRGRPKIKRVCEFPLTGRACVSRIITDLGVFDVSFTEGLTLVEVAEGVSVEEVRSKTEARFKVADDLKTMPS